MRLLKTGILLAACAAILLITTVYFVRAFDSRNMMPLRPEHRITLEQEYRADMEPQTGWADYLQLEDRLAEELARKLPYKKPAPGSVYRHVPGSISNPDTYEPNWNHSFLLAPVNGKGTAVLLHGLSDSPYSVRATAELFQEAGITAIAPRLPGHGFAAGGLRQAHREDWLSVVRIAMREADSRRRPGQPLLLAGYSNGGLLAVRYALDCMDDPDLPCPEGILLISPAFEVTSFAQLANWHYAVSWLDYFEQFQWEPALPEIDPFKFTSFPKNAGREIYELAVEVNEQLGELKSSRKTFPKTLLFQSLVDNTVSTDASIRLFRQLPGNSHELVIYDINRHEIVIDLLKTAPSTPASLIDEIAPFNFSVSIITNRDPGTHNVQVLEYRNGRTIPVKKELGLAWPDNVFSLSHIALPFPPDDPVYGEEEESISLKLGAITPRGERDVLHLEPDYFLRLRHNPFYEYQEKRISDWLETFFH